MIVCHCSVVSDKDLLEAVDRGARSVAAACRSTGAARDCGSCVFNVKRVLCEHVAATATVAGLREVEGAAS